MERIRGFFVQKVGPLPVWAWAAIVLALVLGYMFVTKTGIFAGSNSNLTGGTPAADLGTIPGGSGGAGMATIDPNAGGITPLPVTGAGGFGLPTAPPSRLGVNQSPGTAAPLVGPNSGAGGELPWAFTPATVSASGARASNQSPVSVAGPR